MKDYKIKDTRPRVETVEEFEALLKEYEVANPIKYKLKLKNGDFDRYIVKLGGKPKKAKSKEEPKEAPKKKEKNK